MHSCVESCRKQRRKSLEKLFALLNISQPIETIRSPNCFTTLNYLGELIFYEEFDKLDMGVWQHEITMSGGGNWEFQMYWNNRTNSYAEDGILHIRPTLMSDLKGEEFLWTGTMSLYGGGPADECTNPAFWGCERAGNPTNIINPTVSARIRTVNSFTFKYGTVEVSAKMPAGDWLWPAIWMLPAKNAYGMWPASGEIDLVESRGNLDLSMEGVQIGTQQVGSTLHFGPFWPVNGYEVANYKRNLGSGYHDDFHLYKVEWTPDYIKFTLDGTELGTVTPGEDGFWNLYPFDENYPGLDSPWSLGTKMAPFDQEFYLIVNLAVGGTNGFFPDGTTGPYPKPWSNTSPQAFKDFWDRRGDWYPTWIEDDTHLQVEYVKVWAL
ncbi:unnamed protein product [Darwinula stevensoni]|uniref:GH16 domain-containing protein n=1 Tax=Darwinula stevensoni TaxID=69355 RepID=A0A7R8WY95_9CRUS|nr:unnamed protein product [Darwinula stevensoni]CAG0879122.1 unnamed protein product [Darwinula stevensoni]